MRFALLSLIALSTILSCGCTNIAGIANAAVKYATIKMIFSCIPEGTRIDTPQGARPIESLQPGESVIGYDGNAVPILQKHCYSENPAAQRFRRIVLSNGSTINLCDLHRIGGIKAMDISPGKELFGLTVERVEKYGGVMRSYDLLTTDSGYRISGIPVNSMIDEMANATRNSTR
ncbi:MAG: hypothetical protein GY899_08880 [Verrucomicrobiaceae bacterium]|nr:hypothetical protein [Verrucomicrobiaceae bacterium]